jgi:pimeloyl-ACP methyl ester carboxylesterase
VDANYGYAESGDVRIAYAVIGEGEIDLVVVPGLISHLDLYLSPPASHLFERLARFSRVIIFDKRGTGMSDPVTEVPTLETRMDDLKAVTDAVGSERPVLFGISEGGPTALLYAVTYPERVASLVLYGAMARSTWAPDYPWANTADAMLEATVEFILPHWAQGITVEDASPSNADDPGEREWYTRLERMGSSPAMLAALFAMFMDIDVRGIVADVGVPTLILHRHGDRRVNVRNGRWLAEHVPGARYVELEGSDHSPITNPDQIVDEVEEFVTGNPVRGDIDRVLATVMFTDLVGSTARAAELGDHRWRELLMSLQETIRAELARFRGTEVKTIGDGFLATFDGPVRAVTCGRAIVDKVRSLGMDVRVGLHAGEVEVMGDDVGGIAVHIAARVGALAAAGEVLVSETVKGIVAGSGLTFADRGDHELKGVPDRWRLFAAAG